MKTENRKNFLINLAFVAVVTIGAFLVLRFTAKCLFPFLIGVVLAALTQRPAEFLSKKIKIKSGTIAAVMVLLIFVLLIFAAFAAMFFLYEFLIDAFGNLKDFLPRLNGVFSPFFESVSGYFSSMESELFAPLKNGDLLNGVVENFLERAAQWVSGIAGDVVAILPSVVFTLTVTVVATCYIAKDYKGIKQYIKDTLPEGFKNRCVDLRDAALEGAFKMAKGYVIMFLITFAVLCLGFLILGKENWLILALLVAVVDVLPVLGTGTVLIPWAAIEFIFGNVFLGTGLVILYLVIIVSRHIFEPKIIGKQTGLHPLVCLVAMFVGLKIAGLLGLVLLPLAATVAASLLKSGKIKI